MPKITSPDDLLGAAEVCQILQADRSTVLRWASSGRLRHSKLPGRTGAFVFRRIDVEDFAEQMRSADSSDSAASA